MGSLIVAQLLASGACVAIAAITAVFWWQDRSRTSAGLFVIVAFCAGIVAALDAGMYRAQSVDSYLAVARPGLVVLIVFLAAFTWFLVEYTGTARRWLGLLILAVLGIDLGIHLLSPFTLLFREITHLEEAVLPWGESISVPIGAPTVLRPIVEAPGILLAILFGDATIRLWRRGDRRKAAALLATVGPFLLAFVVWGPLVDLGVIRAPYLFSFLFVAVVLMIGFGLAMEAARARDLSARLQRDEKYWADVVEHIEYLVAGLRIDGKIEFTNPHFREITGFVEADLVGHDFSEFVPIRDRARVEGEFERLLGSQKGTSLEAGLLTRDGGTRSILWSSVVRMDRQDRPASILSIGLDMTEQRRAERGRDRALAELEDLRRQLEEENLFLRTELEVNHGFTEIIGESDALLYVLNRIDSVAATDATVLIEGETGAGKELVARAIHGRSLRSGKPFVRVDCAGLPASLIESELFGHERGAFTGASQTRKGRFELADGGTIFLDEVGELPFELQAKLLRVLQEGEFERLGSSRTRKVDVRAIAATNRDLSREVREGRFREDLFYRLNVIPITVPPLRSRRDDIPLLVGHFVSRLAAQLDRDVEEVPGPVMRRLTEYDWPGNVRELANVLERAVILSHGTTLQLPDGVLGGVTKGPGRESAPPAVGRTLAEVEHDYLIAVLQSTDWRIEGEDGAATILDLNPSTLRSRLKKHGIAKPEARG